MLYKFNDSRVLYNCMFTHEDGEPTLSIDHCVRTQRYIPYHNYEKVTYMVVNREYYLGEKLYYRLLIKLSRSFNRR